MYLSSLLFITGFETTSMCIELHISHLELLQKDILICVPDVNEVIPGHLVS